ncbi:hypothetical protein YC2023_083672 [Brassica napus]
MEDKQVKAMAPSNPSLQVSVSFGRFENDSLSWEKFSAFSPNKYLEEAGKFSTPGSVARKKAYFEAHYKKVAERKAEFMDHQDKEIGKNASFRSVLTDQGSVESGPVTESVVEEGCNGQLTCEEVKHVTDIVKEEVKNSQRLENLKEIALVKEKPDDVEVREESLPNDTNGNTNEIPMKEMEKEKTQKLTKKDEKRTRNSPKPDQVRTKPTTNKTVTSKKTPPNKNMMKTTKKPAAPPVSSTLRVYKPTSKVTSHLGPSASDPTSLTSTRKSLIMERMGDKDIVKRAFKTFQKSYGFKASVDEQKPALKQNPAKPTTKASGMEKRSSTNTRGLKSNVTAEKQQKEVISLSLVSYDQTKHWRFANPKAGVVDVKTRRDSLNPNASSLPVYVPYKEALQKRC